MRRTKPAALGLHWLGLAAPLAVIFTGLLIKGANDGALAALLAACLCALLALRAITAPRDALASALRECWLPALAAIAFAGWAIFTATPASAAFSHPLRDAFGVGPGPASLSPYRTLEGAAAFFGPAAAFALGALAVQERQDRDRIGRLIWMCAGAFAAYAIARHALTEGEQSARRLMVHFGSANAAATTFAILICLIAPYLVRVGRGRISHGAGPGGFAAPLLRAPLACAAFVACATALLLTASRAGALSAALAIIAFALLALIGMRSRGGVAALAATLLVAAGLASVGGQFALERLDTLAGDRLHRDVMVETHWRAFQDRPLIGHGLNTFHELNQLYARPEDYHVLNTIGSAHNIYLQALEETGYVGFALFALMLGPILARLLFAAIEGGSGSEWAAGAFAAAIGALAHGFVDFGLQTPAIAALLMFALGAYARRDVHL